MARKNKAADAGEDGVTRGDRKAEAKLEKHWAKLERAIDQEFDILAKKENYARDELEELRWDYRYDWAPRFKLNEEDLAYFAAQQEAIASGAAPPKQRRPRRAKGGAVSTGQAPGPATAVPTGYARKSDVDIDLIEKYLDRKVYRNTRNEMAQVYKDAFGEDLHIPERVDLVDLAMPAREIAEAQRASKPTKAEIFAGPEEQQKAEAAAKVEEALAAEAAPAVKQESRGLAFATAWRRGVPQRPTYDEKWSILNPFRFWVIPKRFAGGRVVLYYLFFLINLIIFIGQFVLILIPFVLRSILFTISYIWRRFFKRGVKARIKSLKEKAAIPPAGADTDKKPSGAKSS